MIEALKRIHDEADHIIGTEAEDPYVIARVNAATIRQLAKSTIDAAPRIDAITIHHEIDTDPDLSHLGRYSNEPGPDDKTIDRFPDGEPRRHEYRYFIAAMSGDETGNPDSVRQDYQRMEAYDRNEWCMMGIYATAEVSYATDGGYRRIERLQSGGLWGIESDGDMEYVEEVEQGQLDDLKQHLEHLGVDTDNWADVVAKAKRR